MGALIGLLAIAWMISPFIFIPLYFTTNSEKKKLQQGIIELTDINQNLRNIIYQSKQTGGDINQINSDVEMPQVNQPVAEMQPEVVNQPVVAEMLSEAEKQPVVSGMQLEAVSQTVAEIQPEAEKQSVVVDMQPEAVNQPVVADMQPEVEKQPVVVEMQPEVANQAVTPVIPAMAGAIVNTEVAQQEALLQRSAGQVQYYNERPKKQTDPMRVVFGIGVSLIVLAGLVFATTSWASMSTFAKMGSILFMAAVFMGSAWIAEKKLALTSTSIAFYSLGSIAIALMVITYGYFEISDNNINPFDRDNALFYFVTFLIVSVMMTLGFIIYNRAKGFAHIAYNAMGIAVTYLLTYIITDDFYSAFVIVEVLFVMYIVQMFIKINGEKLLDSNFYTIGFGAVLCIIAVTSLAFLSEESLFENTTGKIVFTYCFWTVVTIVSVIVAVIQRKKDDLTKAEEISLFCLAIISGTSVVVRILTNIFYANDIFYRLELFISTVIVLFIVMATSFAVRKRENTFSTRWSRVATIYMFCFMIRAAFFRLNYKYVEDITPWVWLIASVFCLYIAADLQKYARKMALTIAGMFVCFAYFSQTAFEFSGNFEQELYLLVFIPFGLYLYFIVWRTEDGVRNWLITILLSIAVFVESVSIISAGWENDEIYIIIKMLIIAGIAIGCILMCNFHDRMRYLILSMVSAGSIVLGCSSSIADNTAIVLFMYALAGLFIGYGTYYLYKNNRTAWMILPVLIFVFAYGNLLNSTFESYITDTAKYFAWLVAAVVLMAAGVVFHDGIADLKNGNTNINWVGICAVLPLLGLAEIDGYNMRFFAKVMFAIYFFTYNRYLTKKSASIFNIIGGLIILSLWCTQKFFELPDMIEYEWYALGFILFAIFCQFWVFKDTFYDAGWGYLLIALFYTIACFVRALDTESLADVFKIAVVLLALLIMSFVLRSKRWFIFSSISLIIVVIRLTWVLWVSIAWWVYLLCAGLLLIFVAAKNEYNKRNNIERKGLYKRITADWNK